VSWLDIVLLILLVPPVLIGWKFGLIRSLFGLTALIVSIVLAGRFYDPLANNVLGRVFQPSISLVLSFILIFIFAIVAFGIVIVRLDKLVTASILNWVNKFGGAVFGLLVGAIILGAYPKPAVHDCLWQLTPGEPAIIVWSGPYCRPCGNYCLN